MTTEEAITLAESKFWEPLSYYDRAIFQLFENKLCMPFGVFHEAMEKALGRPVYTHEFSSEGNERLKREILGEKSEPTMAEIINLIPPEKRILILMNTSSSDLTLEAGIVTD